MALDINATKLDGLRETTSDGTLPARTDLGAYPIAYYTADGLTVCPVCANDPDTSDPVADADVHWEGPDMSCEDGSSCGNATIASAYGDPDAPEDDGPPDPPAEPDVASIVATTKADNPLTTYADIIRRYGDTVRAGLDRDGLAATDGDLSRDMRRLLVRLLYATAAGHSGSAFVAGDPILTVVYPPSDATRDDAIALLRRIVRDSIAEPSDFNLTIGQWDATVSRAAECLRNM